MHMFSSTQSIYVFWFVCLIHLFKVIIDMHDTISLILGGLFSVGLFLLLCFLPGEVPLAFIFKLIWWC